MQHTYKLNNQRVLYLQLATAREFTFCVGINAYHVSVQYFNWLVKLLAFYTIVCVNLITEVHRTVLRVV